MESLWKHKPQPAEGKTSGAKVEGGTRFKVRMRVQTVYQRTGTRKALSCGKTDKGLESGEKAPPETLVTGEIVRNPKEGST